MQAYSYFIQKVNWMTVKDRMFSALQFLLGLDSVLKMSLG